MWGCKICEEAGKEFKVPPGLIGELFMRAHWEEVHEVNERQ